MKREFKVLGVIAGGVLVMRWVDVVWLVEPSSGTEVAGGMSWMDLVVPLGVGGVWFAGYWWVLGRSGLVALRDGKERVVDGGAAEQSVG